MTDSKLKTLTPKTEPDTEWWRSFHVIEMADLYLNRSSQEELDETSEFLRRELQLTDGARVYDQCCGTGTLSFELAKHNIHATGADLCEAYIERASEQNESMAAKNCEFYCADAFDFVPNEICDAAFNWFSSFGYASTNARNQMMLARAFESIKPSGRFAMDVPNFPALIRGFQKHLVRTGKSNGRSVICVRQCNLNLRAGLLEQTWSWIVEGRPVDERKSALRIYFPHEIVEMLTDVGFESIEIHGGIDKQKLEMDSPRLIIVARRPL